METVYYRDTYLQELKKDFFGTWARTDNDVFTKGVAITSIYTFTNKEVIMETITNSTNTNEKKSYGENSFEITSWEIRINKDNDTNTDYPIGFLVTRIFKDSYLKEEYYLHKNKNSLLEPI